MACSICRRPLCGGLLATRLQHPRELRLAQPEQIGRALSASFIVSGDIIRESGRIHVSWRLLSAAHQSVLTGGSIDSSADELVAVQHEISDEIVTGIAEAGHLPIVARPVLRSSEAVGEADLPPDLVEDYLGGRALLNSQITRSSHEEDLLQARAMFERVTERAPDFAPAHASLGIALTRYVRFGFAGVTDLIAAQRHLERALQLDAAPDRPGRDPGVLVELVGVVGLDRGVERGLAQGERHTSSVRASPRCSRTRLTLLCSCPE